jgi:hypothetical protein
MRAARRTAHDPCGQRCERFEHALPERHGAHWFPAPRGGYIDPEKFPPPRVDAGPACDGDRDHRRVYDCRHTFASWAIEDDRMSLIHLATIMGTSVRQLEDTYFRWLSPTDEQVRTFLDVRRGRSGGAVRVSAWPEGAQSCAYPHRGPTAGYSSLRRPAVVRRFPRRRRHAA